ncbi:MAG: DUF5671 domain-containing protein [Chloroflexota bacterium]
MQTVRRLYVYLLSGITLGFLIYGLITLVEVALSALGVGGGGIGGRLEQLSLAAALIGVGLPVWAIHWWFAERGLDPARPNAEEERRSTVRALYVTVVMIVLLSVGAFAARDLVREFALGFLPRPQDDFYGYSSATTARSLATLVVTAAAWGYHVAIRRRDLARGPLEGAAAWLPRLYVYGATLTGLMITLQAFGDLARYAGETLWPVSGTDYTGDYRSYAFAESLSLLAVWTIGWIGHWWYAGRLLIAAGWRASSERAARLRLAFFVSVILAGAFSVIRLTAEAVRAVLIPVLDATDAIGGNLGETDLVRAVAVALVSAVPWAVAWWLHQRWMHEEALAADDPSREAVATRLDLHAVALVGLAFAAVGTGWLVGLLIDIAMGGPRTLGGSGFWRAELANFVPYTLIGLAVWVWRWWPIQARHQADPPAEAASTIRRSFLLVILAASVITSLGSLAYVLYRLFGSLLGANIGGGILELSMPLGALVAAGAVALYHGLALRRDLALRAASEAEQSATPVEERSRRSLVLLGPPDGDSDAALGALREALPPGFTLDE